MRHRDFLKLAREMNSGIPRFCYEYSIMEDDEEEEDEDRDEEPTSEEDEI